MSLMGLACIISNIESAINLIEESLYMMSCFSLAVLNMLFFFGLGEFNFDVSRYDSLVYISSFC